MSLFLSEEEFRVLSTDASAVAERADAFIRDLRQQLDVVRAEAEAKSIAVEQNCALYEQRHSKLLSELSRLQSENAQLSGSAEERISELAVAQAEKHQLLIRAINKDGEIERLSLEAAEIQKSKRQLLELVGQKDSEILERDATIQSYLDKIVQLTEKNSLRESKLHEIEAELARCQATCTRVTQEKELLEKQNIWLDEELTAKVNSLVELRRKQMDVEIEMSGKITDLERQVKEYCTSLQHSKERVKELELRVKSLEEDLFSSKDIAAANEEHLNAELSTVNKLVELYKESSEEWSKKAGELEGVIKALEMHLSQVVNDYKEKLEKELFLRKNLEKEAADFKIKLEKCEDELENTRKNNEWNLLPLSRMISETGSDASNDNEQMIVPRITAGISGTALAASLLRDGWSLTKMYEKYQEASDALRHEKWGRKHAEAVLERVLHEIEERAKMILEERAEHEGMIDAYAKMNEKLQQALLEHDSYEHSIRKLKAELTRQERENDISQREINDLQKQVTVLLKECQDIQLRCSDNPQLYVEDSLNSDSRFSALVDPGLVMTEHHLANLTFKGINELVEQNVKLRGLVHRLSADLDKKEAEMRDDFRIELERASVEAASKVEVVLKRSEEQTNLIESLHSAVAMYKKLYEEEQKIRTSSIASARDVTDDGKKELMRPFEGSQGVSKKAYEKLSERARILEEDLGRVSKERISVRAERDQMSLEANFAKERLDSFMKEHENQRMECNAVSARNMELTHLLVDYQKRLRESSDSLQASEENSRKLSMEVSILKHEREILASSEKRASDEIRSLMERVHRLQSSLDTIQCAEELRENARAAERRKHDDYLKRVEREWADVKKELLKEKDHNRNVTAEKERAIETCMRQVEDIRKELAEAWHAVTKAEKRAAVAEDRYSELEAKVKYTHTGKQVVDISKHESSIIPSNEVSEEPWNAKEELEKMKEEARASKEYMLQYKEMARTNEIALKQMESAHEDYRAEAIKMKKALEYEVESFKKQVVELERNYMLKCEEVACTIEAKETALTSTMTETSSLRDEVSEKLTRIGILEIQISSLQSDLDKEHKRWRIAQDNYERQVILQSEAIQELTNTSKELALLQAEVSKLNELLDAQKSENELLKSSWEMEKSVLQDLQKEAERKYAETDEQNKALHNHLEALHVRLAEKEQSSVGISSLNFDSQGDGDLQRVISYLRRSKEIAETEITLLKQERMRLQSKLEGALSASESAQSLLRSQLEKSRELLLRDDEFKSLQLQVREINLLRESNVQLREENRHNFEECQKFREEAKKAKAEAKSFEHLLQQKQVEGDAFQKDTEQLKIEIDLLNSRNSEILESYRNIDIKDYERMKDELEQTKESVLKLKQDLANCLVDLSEREKKLSDFEKIEANLKQENERQNRLFNLSKNKAQMLTKEKEELNSKNQALATEMEALKMKYQALMKEKEELNNSSQLTTKEKEDLNAKSLALAKEKVELVSKIHALSKEMEEMNSKNQALLKQLEELKSGKKVSGEMTTEQAKKEQEKDTRIQILEKTLERERDDHRKEKQMRKKTQGTMIDLANRISLDKQKVEDELKKHKTAISVVLEKTGVLASQLPSESSLDEQTSVYFHSLSSFEAATNLFINETEVTQPHPVNASVADNSVNSAGQLVPTQQTKVPKDHSKSTDEREKISAAGKPTLELRKPGRRIVRPSLEKPVELTFDSEISAAETSMSEGKASSSHEHELSASIATAVPTSRKRLTSSELETLEGSVSHAEVSINDAPPLAKRLKESEFEEISDTCDVQPSSETFDRMPHQDVPQPDISQMQILQPEEELEPENVSLIPNEEVVNLVKEEEDIPVNEETEEHEKVPIDAVNLNEVQYGGDVIVDEPLGEGLKGEEIKVQDSTAYGEAREEGELMTEEPEQQPDDAVSGEGQLDSVTIDEADDAIEIASLSNEQDALPIASEDTEKTTCSINDQGALDPERSLELSRGAREESPTSHLHSVASVQQTLIASSEEASESQVSRSSRTISIAERARQNAQLRQAGIAAQQQQQQQQSPQRGRGRVVFRRGRRGGRG